MGGMTPLRWAIVGLYVALCAALMIDIGSFDNGDDILFGIGVFAWVIAPVVLLALLSRLGVITAIAAALLGTGALYLYWRAFYGPDIDPQSGLVFIILPLYQFAIAAMVAIVAVVLRRRSRGKP